MTAPIAEIVREAAAVLADEVSNQSESLDMGHHGLDPKVEQMIRMVASETAQTIARLIRDMDIPA